MLDLLKKKNLQPIYYAVFVIVGLLMGKSLYQDKSYQQGLNVGTAQKGKLHDILKKVNSYYVDDVDLVDIQEKTIASILDQLDPHSRYINKAMVGREEDKMNGNFRGIGISYRIHQDTIIVLHTIPGGPSRAAGLQGGDKIVSVDDQSFIGDSIRPDYIRNHLRGENGSHIKLGILRGEHQKSFEFNRGEVPLNSIVGESILEQNIGYIQISHFSQRTHREFVKSYERLLKKGATSLIIDVRGNGGGILDAVVHICDELLPKGRLILKTKGREDSDEYKSESDGPLKNIPLCVLIDEQSASASEILAGAIQDNDRGTIIGRRSFGKGLVQNTFKLMDGSKLRLTIARYYTPVGRCIQRAYNKGKQNYYSDVDRRYENGELFHQDSIDVIDSLVFKTPKGKTVYGGGGIIPDVFVPLDSTVFNPTANQLILEKRDIEFYATHAEQIRKDLSGINIKNAKKVLIQKQWIRKYQSFLSGFGEPIDKETADLLQVNLLQLIFKELYPLQGQAYLNSSNAEVQKAIDLLQAK